MHSLRESQLAFAEGLPDEAEAWPARHEQTGGVPSDPRFNVYRGSTHATLCDALAVIYPVVGRLVDVRFFRQTARQYLRAFPVATGDLRGFGSEFPQFLSELGALRALPYVADVARFEWALFEVQNAPDDSRRLDPHRFGCVRDGDWRRLRFQLHRATALVASLFPVRRIWNVHQDEAPAQQDVDLDAGGVRLLVARTGTGDVTVRELSVGEYTLLHALARERALEDAIGFVMLVDPAFDLMQALVRFIEQGVLIGFRPNVLLDLG